MAAVFTPLPDLSALFGRGEVAAEQPEGLLLLCQGLKPQN